MSPTIAEAFRRVSAECSVFKSLDVRTCAFCGKDFPPTQKHATRLHRADCPLETLLVELWRERNETCGRAAALGEK